MKTISYHQPYAWMLANGYLDIDDRTWGTKHRGDLAIHASKRFSPHYYDFVKNGLGIDIPAPEDLEYGGIVAIVNLTHCLSPGEPTNVRPERRAHGGSHCFGWVVDNVRPVDFIPYRGQQGLFEVDVAQLIAEPPEVKPANLRLF